MLFFTFFPHYSYYNYDIILSVMSLCNVKWDNVILFLRVFFLNQAVYTQEDF